MQNITCPANTIRVSYGLTMCHHRPNVNKARVSCLLVISDDPTWFAATYNSLPVCLIHVIYNLIMCVLYTDLSRLTRCVILLNFHPLEVVSRYRDPQLQVGVNDSYLLKLKPNICKSWCLIKHNFNKYESFTPTWSCVSLTRPTTSSGCKLLIFVEVETKYLQILMFN